MDARNYLVRRFALVVAGLFFLSGNSTGCSIDHKPSAKKTDAMVDGSVTDDAQIDANEGEQAGSEEYQATPSRRREGAQRRNRSR